MEIWKELKYLNEDTRLLIENYFEKKDGKFKIENDILYVDFDDWGIEKFYVKNIANRINYNFYTVIQNKIKKIYNIGISIQIGNWNIFKKMEHFLKNFDKINVNIYFIFIKDILNNEIIEYLKKNYKNYVILSGENRGMDIGLFFINLHFILQQKYNHEYIFKIHTKTNDDFRNQTLNILVPSHERIIDNLKILSKESIGMYSGNAIYKFHEHKDLFHVNYYHLQNLVHYLYNEDINHNYLEFCAGTMFIFKQKIFDILTLSKIEYIYNMLNNIDTIDYYWYSIFYKMNIQDKEAIYNDYMKNKNIRYPNNISYSLKTNKPGLRDSMIEHAVERLFGYICKKNNMNIAQ